MSYDVSTPLVQMPPALGILALVMYLVLVGIILFFMYYPSKEEKEPSDEDDLSIDDYVN